MGVLFRGLPDDPSTLSEVLGQGVGAASVCWEDIAKAGVFDSDRAKQIVDEMQDYVDRQIRVQWLDGYRWALEHLEDQGVLSDAVQFAKEKRDQPVEMTNTLRID